MAIGLEKQIEKDIIEREVDDLIKKYSADLNRLEEMRQFEGNLFGKEFLKHINDIKTKSMEILIDTEDEKKGMECRTGIRLINKILNIFQVYEQRARIAEEKIREIKKKRGNE